jgi:hypothetical protein
MILRDFKAIKELTFSGQGQLPLTFNVGILKLWNLAVCPVFTYLHSITTQSPGGRGVFLKRQCYDGGKLPLLITTSNYPLDKIFEDIPARSEDPIHASVRHFHSNFSKDMIWFRSFLDLSGGCSSGYPNGITATTRTDSGIVRIFLTSSSLKAPIQHVPNPSS